MHPGQTACDETRAAQFSRWGLGRRSIPAKQPVMKPTRRSAGDPSRLNRVAFAPLIVAGRNTLGIPPSRALSARRLGRRSIPAEPRRCAPLIVAFRSKYTRYSSLTRLVSQAPHRPRRSPGFHHRLFTTPLRPPTGRTGVLRCVSVEIHAVFLPHAPCQPGPHRENWAPPGELGLAALGAHPGSTTGCQPDDGG